MNDLQMLEVALNETRRLYPEFYRTGRMDIIGTAVVDQNIEPWIGRGAVLGHGEQSNDTDCRDLALMGMNTVRIGVRRWGTYLNGTTDSSDPTQTSLTNHAYAITTRNRFLQARRAGLKTLLFFDSNCGQTERTGDTVCELGLGAPQTFWTPGGQAKLDEQERVERWFVRQLRGLVDFVEPVVEPNPLGATIPTGNLETDVKHVQARLMDAMLAEDPELMFLIGPAPDYQTSRMRNWFEPTWLGKYKIMYTGDILDNAATGANMLVKVDLCTDTRAMGAPVGVQQVGTIIAHDPGDNFARAVLDALNNPRGGGGSLHWWWWEMLSVGDRSYGWLSGDAVNRAVNLTRQGTLQAAAAAPRFYA